MRNLIQINGSVMHTDGFVGKRDYNGIDVKVMGRASAQQYEPTQNEVIISISSYDEKWAELSPNFKDYLYLTFDDCMEYKDSLPEDLQKRDVFKLIDFVKKHIDTADRLVIHCFAGISRSRSIAAAVADGFNLPYKFTVYNSRVYNLVLDEIKSRG